MTILATAGAFTLARFADDALACTLGHSTMRLGTDPLSWIAIHTLGITPDRDPSQFGMMFTGKPCIFVSTADDQYGIKLPSFEGIVKTNLPVFVNKFLDALTSKIIEYRINELFWAVVGKAMPILKNGPILYLSKKVLMHTIPFAQKMSANYHRIHHFSPINGLIKAAIVTPAVFLTAILTPTIKIRGQENSFEEPERLVGRVILVSKNNYSLFNIGLIGTLRHSLRLPPLFSNPSSVLKGAVQLGVLSGVAYGAYVLCPAFISAHQTAIVAGAIFAVI